MYNNGACCYRYSSRGFSVMTDNLLDRVVLNPKVMAGKPVIRGTRIPVELLVRMVAQSIPNSEILREYPGLQSEDIRAAFAYAAQVVANDEVIRVTLSPYGSPM